MAKKNVQHGTPWSKGEERLMFSYYRAKGSGPIVKATGRPENAVHCKAQRMGLSVGATNKHPRLVDISFRAGCNREHAFRMAHKDGVLHMDAVGYSVPPDWAEKFIADYVSRAEAEGLRGLWYGGAKVARIFGIRHSTINDWVRGMGRLGDVYPERVEIREGFKGRRFHHPWQVEALARDLRKGVAVLTRKDADLLIRLANGDEIYYVEGDLAEGDVGHFVVRDEEGNDDRLPTAQVRRLQKSGVIQKRHGSKTAPLGRSLTDLGWREVEIIMDRMDDADST